MQAHLLFDHHLAVILKDLVHVRRRRSSSGARSSKPQTTAFETFLNKGTERT